MERVPEIRIRRVNDDPVRPDGDFVLYWMIAHRRTKWNFSLQRAVELARELGKPLVILEALRTDYPWASDRIHWFMMQAMAEHARRLARTAVAYYPYVEPQPGAGKGLLRALGRHASVVISDDFPCSFLPRMVAAAAKQLPVRLELVDSNGLLPMRAANKVFARAFDFRRFLQRELLAHLLDFPREDPLSRAQLHRLESLPSAITRQWPPSPMETLVADTDSLARLPINHGVSVAAMQGGTAAAEQRLRNFIRQDISSYLSRNQPEPDVASGLSPWLHCGHISAHQVFVEVTANDDWSPGNVVDKVTGSSRGWWGASEPVESFLDELITWRELGFNMCWQRADYDEYDSLPEWVQQTLGEHESDPRTHLYSLQQFESADTYDELWNAAQRQLVREGRLHNYLRMLWGKKILEWSATPRQALDVMIELNNKYALDGRDPNSYSGIFWVLGRYDRAWGPERPVFGKIRYMSSENTARKVSVNGYLHKYRQL